MAKPNYRQAKRHKELARKARQEQKMRRRSGRALSTSEAPETAEQNAAAAPGQLEQPASPPDT